MATTQPTTEETTKDWHCANCGEPIQIPLDADGTVDPYYCDECQASMTGDGNVSVTDADKTADKAKTNNVNFNVNVAANYDRLVSLASSQYDEDGNPYSVHRFAKETLFAALNLSMAGEVLRKAKGTPKQEEKVLAKVLGADRIKNMTRGDRAKAKNQVMDSLYDAIQANPEMLAQIMAAMASKDSNVNRQETLDDAKRLAK